MRASRAATALAQPPASQPDGFILQTSDLDEIEDLVGRLITPHRLEPMGPTDGVPSRLHLRSIGSLRAFDCGFSGPVAIDFTHPRIDDFVTALVPVAGAIEARFDGSETIATDGQAIIFKPGVRKQLKYRVGCDSRVLFLDRERLTRHCAHLLGRDLPRPLDFDPGFDLTTDRGRQWLRLMDYVWAEVDDPGSLLRASPLALSQLEQLVMTKLLLAQPHTYSEGLLRPQSAAAPFYVKRAEAYIEEHADEPLSVPALAAQIGVSARSLYDGFQRFRETTPVAHLKTVRLRRVRDDLLNADPSSSSVTEVAVRWGFSNLGNFAVAYRQRFGESPRDTLRRER
jgi:AraC-like DNA-binding protein